MNHNLFSTNASNEASQVAPAQGRGASLSQIIGISHIQHDGVGVTTLYMGYAKYSEMRGKNKKMENKETKEMTLHMDKSITLEKFAQVLEEVEGLQGINRVLLNEDGVRVDLEVLI